MEQSDLDLLHAVPPYHLQALAKLRRLPLPVKGQNADIVDVTSATPIADIARDLFEPSVITELLRDLSAPEQMILRELVLCGGRANSRDLALYFASSGLLNRTDGALAQDGRVGVQSRLLEHGRWQESPLQYPAPHPHGVFEQALHRLLLLGLVFWGKQTNFAGRDYASGVYDGVLIVPRAVMAVADEVWKGEDAGARPAEGDAELGETIRAVQRALYLYWSLVSAQREGLPLLSNGLLSRPALRQVIEHMNFKSPVELIRAENEAPRLLFMRLLLLKSGLLQRRQNALYAAPAEAFFALPLLERARRCYRLWLETPFWNELGYLPNVIVRPSPGLLDPAHEEVIQARRVVVDQVLHEPAGAWSDLSAFATRSKLYMPYLLFPRQYGPRADRYSVGSNPYGLDFRLQRGWLTHREGWYLVEGGFVKTVISGPLHWLGLIELQSEGHSSMFRLAQGAPLVTADAPPEVAEPAWGRLIVQPNFELIALAPVSEALLVNLDRFAERIGLEHIAQYRLTRASVTRAIQKGMHADTVQLVLEQASGGDLPQNVQYSLLEWERQARRVELWRGATLLEVHDAALLDTLFAHDAMRPLLGRRLAPTLAEVTPEHLASVQEALWQLGYLPALTAAAQHDGILRTGRLVACESQWRLNVDGLLEPRYAVIDLYLAAELEHISELDEATNWRRITPAAIQRARAADLPLEHIIAFLQQYCEGGVPASFLIRLKLWGGGYGEQHTMRIEHAPLLSLSSQALQDLRADEALQGLLGTEVEQHKRLVRVAPEHLERVIELLKERGFEIL
ncbi:MAG: helicase-associated domain-containing protein [Chloroflexota bacterium]|nr:helicase-associated domain-containing protein [Chloroflexota bacterium]